MAEYKVRGIESERTGEVHLWITRDGVPLGLEEIRADLTEQQDEIERLRALLHAACESEEAFWEDMELHYPGTDPDYELWYEAAKKAAGGDDE